LWIHPFYAFESRFPLQKEFKGLAQKANPFL
jgi:hypothetical protein